MITSTMIAWKGGINVVSLSELVTTYSEHTLGAAKGVVERLLAGEVVTLEFHSESQRLEFRRRAEEAGVIFEK